MDGNQADASNKEDTFALAVLEALGTLTLAVHHLRGRISWLVTSDAVEFKSAAAQVEFQRHDKMIAELEEELWEIVPPRALLVALRRWRLTGELDADYRALLEHDYRGRVPYTAKPLQLEEILKRIADVKSYDGGKVIRD
jgi:hypothetical protein